MAGMVLGRVAAAVARHRRKEEVGTIEDLAIRRAEGLKRKDDMVVVMVVWRLKG